MIQVSAHCQSNLARNLLLKAASRMRLGRTFGNWAHLFAFVTHQTLQATGNAAQQALRPVAQWSKLCLGQRGDSKKMSVHGKNPMNPNVGWIVTWQGIAGPAMPYLSTGF